MILGAGIFIILLAGLGVARSGQLKEQERLETELAVSETRLNNLQVSQFQAQISELQEQLKDTQERSAEAMARLDQTVISVDVAEKFYEIADYFGVTVTNISTTTISSQPYSSVNCETISITAAVSGDAEDLVDFVIGLNDNFTTGFVKALQLGYENNEIGIQMIVYSRKGS